MLKRKLKNNKISAIDANVDKNRSSPHLTLQNPLPSKNSNSTTSPALKPETPKEEFLDLKQALVPQMFSKKFSKEFYLQEVHKPRFLRGSALFFDQPYLEVFTRTPWYVIPLFWTPVIAWHLMTAFRDFSSDLNQQLTCAGLFVTGMFVWTLLEYVFHRFLFHMERILPSHQVAYSIHFLLHGVHHFLPMDRMRLVMPPILFIFLSAGPYSLFRSILGQRILNPLYSGVVTAYIAYDLFHYFFHHGVSKFNFVNYMKSYHMAHHYKDYNKGYGVTSALWDFGFHTTFDYSKVKLNFKPQ